MKAEGRVGGSRRVYWRSLSGRIVGWKIGLGALQEGGVWLWVELWIHTYGADFISGIE